MTENKEVNASRKNMKFRYSTDSYNTFFISKSETQEISPKEYTTIYGVLPFWIGVLHCTMTNISFFESLSSIDHRTQVKSGQYSDSIMYFFWQP